MSRFPPKFILREVARAAKERGLLEAADASVEVRRPRLPNVGTRKPAFPEDKFVKDALARFPILRDVPVALVTPLKDFPHPAKAFGTHRFKLWEMRQVTDRVSLLQTMKDFFWHPVEEQREWWRWALMVHDAGLARAYFPEAASLAKGSVDLDATPVASTSGVESGESAHGEAAAGVPAQEGATGPRSSGAESGSAVAAGTEDAGTGLRGPWWKEGTFQHSSLVSRTIVELAERLPTSGVEPPVCNMELLRRGSQYQEDGVLSTLSMVQDWEEEVLEDALVAQVMIHGKNRAERIPVSAYAAATSGLTRAAARLRQRSQRVAASPEA